MTRDDYVDRIVDELDRLEDIGGPDTDADYEAILLRVKRAVEQRLAVRREIRGGKTATVTVVICDQCGTLSDSVNDESPATTCEECGGPMLVHAVLS